MKDNTMTYQSVQAEKEKEERRKAVRKSAKRVHAKAEAVGIFYLLFTIIFTVAVFLPLYTGTTMGNLWVGNFWKPFLELKNIKGNVIPVLMSVSVSLLYAFVLLSAVVNFFSSLGCLGQLFKKTWTAEDNYNRNRNAMVKIAKNFTGTYSAMIIFGFIMHLIGGITFTTWFYAAVLLGLIVHFWLGLVGGNVSRFVFVDGRVGKKKVEMKRPIGRFAPFMRNLLQIVIVASVMMFISRMNVITNLWYFVEKGAFKSYFNGPKFDLFLVGLLPILQILMLIWTLGMFKHAIGLTEYEFPEYGKKQKGRKTFGWFAFLLLLTAGGTFTVTYIGSTKYPWYQLPIGTLYVATLALAAIILELTTRRLPNEKKKAVKANEAAMAAETGAEPTYAPTAVSKDGYYIPLQCITQPAVFMQPNGQPIMVMPMVAGAQPTPAQYEYPAYRYSACEPTGVQAVGMGAAQERPASTLVREKDTYPVMNGPVGGPYGVALNKEEADAAVLNNKVGERLKQKWINMADQQVPGEEDGFTGKEFLKLPKKEAVRLSEEDLSKPLPAKRWAVACPDCGTKLNVKEGSFAYRCPDCGEVFRVNRVYKNKKNK